jgi:3'-phosphoadenosine 5'-phosphosulfate sulfotransferase (PAPS reductase)/FAD synthetase
MLGKKQNVYSQADWLRAYRNAPQHVSTADVERLIEQTVTQIKHVCQGKTVGVAWSGGKDSLVLERIMALAGYSDSVLVLTHLEYPAFVRWVHAHQPPHLTIVHTYHDLAWLRAHPDMLFPRDSAVSARWFHQVQHAGQDLFFRKHRLHVLALGRRRIEGNYCGNGGLYTTSKGVTRYSPLMLWTHEQIFAALHYFDCPLPPCYTWPRGFAVGTGPWAKRRFHSSLEYVWSELWEIDQTIVLEAAKVLPAAAAYLAVRDTDAILGAQEHD